MILTRLLLAAVLGAPLAAPLAAQAQTVSGLKLLGNVTVANDTLVDGTLVGGLSGLDYDAKSGLWYALSDDKSDIHPARFFTLKLDYSPAGFTGVAFLRSVALKQADGTNYPNTKQGGDVPDPEAIRLDPIAGKLWWTSEGDRRLGLNPFLRIAETDGRHIGAVPVPSMFAMNKDREVGPRHNNVFEGLSFAPDGNSVWLGMESALYEDGPIATVDAGTVVRLTRLDRAGTVVAQYALPIDPIQAKPLGKNGDNGLTEILALDDTRLLQLERSGVEGADGVWKMYIRLYEIETKGATDVQALTALKGADIKPATKRLVLDLSKDAALGPIDNLECLAFGPDLPNGHKSLVMASDNNFNKTQITQFLAFEVIP